MLWAKISHLIFGSTMTIFVLHLCSSFPSMKFGYSSAMQVEAFCSEVRDGRHQQNMTLACLSYSFLLLISQQQVCLKYIYSNGIDSLSAVLWILKMTDLLLVISHFTNGRRASGMCLLHRRRLVLQWCQKSSSVISCQRHGGC